MATSQEQIDCTTCINLAPRACFIQKGEKACRSRNRTIGCQKQYRLQSAMHAPGRVTDASHLRTRAPQQQKVTQVLLSIDSRGQRTSATLHHVQQRGVCNHNGRQESARFSQPAITCAISTLHHQRASRVCRNCATKEAVSKPVSGQAFRNRLLPLGSSRATDKNAFRWRWTTIKHLGCSISDNGRHGFFVIQKPDCSRRR